LATKPRRFKARSSKRRPHLTLQIGHKPNSRSHDDTAYGQTQFQSPSRSQSPFQSHSRLGLGLGRESRAQSESRTRTAVSSLSVLIRLPFQFAFGLVSGLKARMGLRARIVTTIAVSLVLVVAAPAGVAVLIHKARTASASTSSFASSSIYTWNHTTDAAKTISVYNQSNGQVMDVALNQYILNVLAAQMPPTAPMASLQAASVVIRTYAVSAMTHSGQAGNKSHRADVTTSGINDLQWLTDAQQVNLFATHYAADEARLREAVSSTDGLILTYQNAPIDAFLTQVSTGETRSGKTDFPKHPPYLVSVKCPADVHAPNFEGHFTFTKGQLAQMLKVKSNQIDLKTLKVKARDKQGYATVVTDKSHTWTGAAFAAKLELPSAAMNVHVTALKVKITTKGIGNGYGISLYQARAWAKSGESWQNILHKFYPGTKIQPSSL
jgi:stage II sporulation protein D